MRILLVEADPAAVHGITLMLKSSGAVVDHTDTGEEGLELTGHYDYDIVVLDLILPDMDGFEVVQRMRLGRNDTPVLILSGPLRPEVRAKGLNLGADDFITKPFDTTEFVALLHAIVRRNKGLSHPLLRFGPLQLDLNAHEVSVNGQAVAFTVTEYVMLELLAVHKGESVSRETFLDHLYGGIDEPAMKSLDVVICKLRKKLAAAGADELIVTVRGRGYLLRDPTASQPMTSDRKDEREAA
jgi:two-component system cell cycle response regulator CtrA